MPGENWLAGLVDHEIERRWDEAKAMVDRTRRLYPDGDPDLLVNEIISDRARIAAFVGIGAGALECVPVVGQALAIGAVVPEAVYLASVQVKITLVMSLLYERHLTKQDVKGVVVTCLALALGADFIKKEVCQTAVRITRRAVQQAITRMGERELARLLGRIGVRATCQGILKKVPIISLPLNAAMNHGQIKAFGWVAKKFLSPSFVMCGTCGSQTGRLNHFCPSCGAAFDAAAA